MSLVVDAPCATPLWMKQGDYQDIICEVWAGIGKVTINRPHVRNAFRPETVSELIHAFTALRENPEVGAILFTGMGSEAFCSGGDQKVRGDTGYKDLGGAESLGVLELQRLIRQLPKPVIALVAGYAIGGGHVLHLICDLTIAADNARFGQVGPRVGSFDGGLGMSLLIETIGLKRAKEVWFLCRQYSASEAHAMGLVNKVVALPQLEYEGIAWAHEILKLSPTALRMLKACANAYTDGAAGLQELAGNATMLFYMTEEAQEGRNAFLEKRSPNYSSMARRGGY